MQITLDEGYQFGLGLFETIAVERGKPLLLPWHLERLADSMEELGIHQHVDEASILSWLSEKNASHHALKIMVSDENLLYTLRPNPYTEIQIQAGFHLSYSSIYRNETSPLVRHKTLNYGDCILEKRRAKTLCLDESIFCNSRGEICEGTTTNAQPLYKEDVLHMDGCFVTNSLMGVMPVHTLDQKRFSRDALSDACLNACRALFL